MSRLSPLNEGIQAAWLAPEKGNQSARPPKIDRSIAPGLLARLLADRGTHARASALRQMAANGYSYTDCFPTPSLDAAAACLLRALHSHSLMPPGLPMHKCGSWPKCSALNVGARMAATGAKDELWLEFGAWRGASARLLARRRAGGAAVYSAAHVYSFDSFRGLPERWREPDLEAIEANAVNAGGGKQMVAAERANAANMTRAYMSKGSFDRGGQPPFHEPGIHWEVGWFNETLPRFLARMTANASLVHIDCDIYSSAAFVLTALEPRLAPGALLVFDELINYPGFEKHELKALLELQRRSNRVLRVYGTLAKYVVDATGHDVLNNSIHFRLTGTEMPHAGKLRQDALVSIL